MSSLAVGEGYRATERELLARDAAARRAAIDELLGAVPAEGRAASRLRRLAMRYGLDPDASYRVAAILPGPGRRPDARATRHRRRRPRDDGPADRRAAPTSRPPRRRRGTGIRIPLALTWRGAIVAILGPDPREWQRLQEAVAKVFGSEAPSWIAIATHGRRRDRRWPDRSPSSRRASGSPTASIGAASSTTCPSSASSACC